MSFVEDCIFCKIIKGKIPSSRVYEDKTTLAIKDITPIAPVHYLFIPKTHVSSMVELDPKNLDVMNKIFMSILKVAKAENLNEKGYRVMINNGAEAGQSVFHLHVHVISGKKLNH